MKVNITKYKSWATAPNLPDYFPDWIDLGIQKVINIVWNSWGRDRKEEVRIDPWDTWNLDSTLALIVTPMLKQLIEKQHGSPFVEYKDAPKEFTPTEEEIKKSQEEGDTDPYWHERWTWVLNEMLFAFEMTNMDWESKFHTGVTDIVWKKIEDTEFSEMTKGPKDTSKFDKEGYEEVANRIQKGYRLFGTYYQGLWD